MTKRLDLANPPDVGYCIPLWLRDSQIEAAIRRVRGRIEPHYEDRPESLAIVCYGPSLADTWEKVREFPVVMSCSGAHKFLRERGIDPHYHVEVDPRAHKTALIGEPCPTTEYLIASTCHAAVFDHLEGMNVKLWHVFDSKEDGIRTLPHGEWALTGGVSVGVRTLTIAGFLGFRDLHVFGMDGCEGATGKHASEHPNQPKGHAEVEYPEGSGNIYRTTASMLAAAMGTWHELNQMPSVRATFYGEGLVQAMARDYKPDYRVHPKGMVKGVAIRKPEVISAEYADLNAQLHRENPAYGVGGDKHAENVIKLTQAIKSRNVLDYGCGKGRLARALPFGISEYDPAIPGKTESPKPHDLVVCTDVLEHIEPDKITAVLADLQRVTLLVGYLVIHTGPAAKTLPDGRNTHLLQRDKHWWFQILSKFFTVGRCEQQGMELYVVVGPKKAKKPKAQQKAEAVA